MRINKEAETPEAGKKNIKVLSADLPDTVRGVAAWDAEDRKYIVLINSKLAMSERAAVIAHELDHISKGDILKAGTTADRIEYAAHEHL